MAALLHLAAQEANLSTVEGTKDIDPHGKQRQVGRRNHRKDSNSSGRDQQQKPAPWDQMEATVRPNGPATGGSGRVGGGWGGGYS